MIFNKGDKVMANLGGTTGTLPGQICDIREGGKCIFVQLDNGSTAMLDPWDVFPDEDEPEYRRKLALAIDADIIREQEMNGE